MTSPKKILRSALEYVSRGVVLRRKLPQSFGDGHIYLTPAARLSYWKPNIGVQEKLLFDIADLLVSPGDAVWDVGSNNGVFAVAAAARAGAAGEVLAFEPDTWMGSLVRKTAAELPGGYAAIDVLNVAVADKIGLAEFAIAARGRAANFLVEAGGSPVSGGIRTKYRVLTVSLDDMLPCARPPKVIKIDIEWAEHLAFRGSLRMLRDVRPRIICEVQPKYAEELTQIAAAHGYFLFDAEADSSAPVRVQQAVHNTLFLPREDALVGHLDGRGSSR
jgi:FkbM family methyltransferase